MHREQLLSNFDVPVSLALYCFEFDEIVSEGFNVMVMCSPHFQVVPESFLVFNANPGGNIFEVDAKLGYLSQERLFGIVFFKILILQIGVGLETVKPFTVRLISGPRLLDTH